MYEPLGTILKVSQKHCHHFLKVMTLLGSRQAIFFFQTIKAFKGQGSRAAEAGALGARFLCLCQWGQFGAEDIPTESCAHRLLQKRLPGRGVTR